MGEHSLKLGETCDGCGLTCTEQADNDGGEYGIDPCLGKIDGVLFACCGHGVSVGYIAFPTRTLRFLTTVVEEHKYDGDIFERGDVLYDVSDTEDLKTRFTFYDNPHFPMVQHDKEKPYLFIHPDQLVED
jgi:hypothetical protein